MNRNNLVIILLVSAALVIAYSWYSSYPLSMNSANDNVFNHISLLYWASLPAILVALFAVAVVSRNYSVKWIAAIALVVTIYSLAYFYRMLPGSDSHYFRGLTEYFVQTRNLDASQQNHIYFQWPSFFLFNDITTSISGLGLPTFEFISYTVIGLLMSTALYVHFSKTFRNGAFLAVAAFFISVYSFLNYQSAPFSLAFGILLTLFMLENRQRSIGATIAMMALYIGITFMHAFVPLFFILYLFFRFLVNRDRRYIYLFALTLTIYAMVQITQALLFFAKSIRDTFTLLFASEYSGMVDITISGASLPVDRIVQTFSRTATVLAIALCLIGFIFALTKKKMRDIDKAIFFAGIVYSAIGIVLSTLGSRAIPMAFIPVALGAAYLFESKYKRILGGIFCISLIFFVFVPMHASLGDYPIFFQTKNEYETEHFILDKYDMNASTTILSEISVRSYLRPQVPENVELQSVISVLFKSQEIGSIKCIVYDIGFEKALQKSDMPVENASREILSGFDVVYNSGTAYIAVRP
ncbi:MAG: hypothetical protein ACE14S_05430 [Candidatus Bathyarchaeia archaeon]